MDYQEARIMETPEVRSVPFINKSRISPLPNEALSAIPLGGNCKGKDFFIPPIRNPSTKNPFYYLWFIKQANERYGRLLLPGQGTIQPENANSAVISITLNKETLENALGPLTDDFYAKPFLIEFDVSDKKYLSPENRYLDADANEDSVYWVVSFTKC